MSRTPLSQTRTRHAGILLLALAAGCEPPFEDPHRQSAPPVTRVEIVRPERQTVRRIVGEPGELEAYESTAVHAKIPGYVKTWTANIGERVKKGQVLVELSVPEMEAEVHQKEAVVAQARAGHKQAGAAIRVAETNVAAAEARLMEVRAGVRRSQADLAYWRTQMGRVTQLVQERAVTESLLDETRSKLHSAESAHDEVLAHVKTAEVGLVQAQAGMDQTRADLGTAAAAIDVAQEETRRVQALLGYSRIEAPFDGIVIQRNVDTGELTQPGADKPPLFVIARSDLVTIRLDVPEVYATSVNPGDRAEIKLQAVQGPVIAGKVTRTSWALDPKVRTLRIEIDMPNPGAKLQPGLYVYATIVAEEHSEVLTVPATAIVTENGKDFCVVVAGGTAARRPIQIGLSDGTRTEVVSGLEGNESVVKSNSAALTDGQLIQTEQPPAR